MYDIKPLANALNKMAKKRCFICDKNKIITKVSMWTYVENDTIWCDVPCCQECKERVESDD